MEVSKQPSHNLSPKGNLKLNIGLLLLQGRTFIALFILLIVFSIIAPNFLTPQTLILILKHASLYTILAIGMTFVIVSGGIDLSVGSIVGLAGMIAGGLIYEGLVIPALGVTLYFNMYMVIVITLLAGVLVGAVNGILVTRFRVAPFIATLGVLYAARGLAMLRSDGKTFPNLVGREELGNTGLPILGSGTILGIPLSIYIMLGFALVGWYIFNKTPLGWHIFAVGGNEKAAELSGVEVKRVKMFVYMFSGLCAAMVGLIVASQLQAAHPATGETWELTAIAAAVLGGTSLSGGKGSVISTVMGALVITVLVSGMVMIGVSQFWQMVITGGVIIFAVIIDQFQAKLQEKLALEQRV